jgi:hypothetical protein
MAINLQCDCGRALRLKDHLAGKRVKCPECNNVLSVPNPEIVEDAGFEVVEQESEEPAAARSQDYRSEYASPPSPPPAPPKKKRKRMRPKYDEGRSGSSKIPGVILGLVMMVGAVIWFVVALSAGWIFFYPPILFILGLIRLVKSLLGHEEEDDD